MLDQSTITMDQLRIGMYVHLDLKWFEHPFAFSHFKIKTEEQIKQARAKHDPIKLGSFREGIEQALTEHDPIKLRSLLYHDELVKEMLFLHDQAISDKDRKE